MDPSDWVLEKQEGDRNHSNPFGHIGHCVREGGDQLEEGEGEDVLEPVEAAVDDEKEANFSVELLELLSKISLKILGFHTLTLYMYVYILNQK